MSENNTTNSEAGPSGLEIMGRGLPFYEGIVRRTGYSKHIVIPKDYAFKHHLNEGRRVHVYIVPVDETPEISGAKE